MLKVIGTAESNKDSVAAGVSRSLIAEIVREGAQGGVWGPRCRTFVDRVDENGRKLLLRNGYHNERPVLTAVHPRLGDHTNRARSSG